MERDRIEPIVRAAIAASPRPIAAAWLFGSIARGTERPDSDVDVAVLYSVEPKGTLDDFPFELEAELEPKLGRTVQIIVMNTAPPELAVNALNAGRLLFERDASKRVDFEVRIRNEYWDLLPILELYRHPDRARR